VEPADQDLVDRCRHGDRDAFAEIVERYQKLVCSVAYGSTGSLAVSEELAQEAFVAAWSSLGRLREPPQLGAWLCGIARNLARKYAHGRSRDVLQTATTIDEANEPTAGAGPLEATISREETALMDRTLEEIPATYREPLILYYREEESVARVAELLELSEDAVKQRLARGRKLLRREIAARIESGLRRSVPGRAFTMGVLAALPVLSGTAKAATLTAAGAKGVTAMNAAGWSGMLGAILGPVAGIAGAWFGLRMSLKSARSPRERAFIIRYNWWFFGLITVFTVGVTSLSLLGRDLVRHNPRGFAFALVGLALGYVIALSASIVWFNKRQARIRREEETTQASPAEVAAKFPRWMRRWQYPAIYESPLRLFGLPLVSIRFNGVVGDARERKPAIGWIAIGDIACGILFANGALAVGGIAIGAVGVGVVSFGGLAFGLLSIGGGTVGWLALGGIAIGWLAFGGFAVALHAAVGGLAVARHIALGGVASAQHANDEVARQLLVDHGFFRVSNMLTTHGWLWLVLVAITLLPMFWARTKVGQAEKQ
jgi:RNA polymerase sigma factor (sigma-70 family)